MKVLSIILALFVVLMCSAPALTYDDCMQEALTGNVCDDCCPCSPFMACFTCVGFVVSPTVDVPISPAREHRPEKEVYVISLYEVLYSPLTGPPKA